MMKKLYLLLLSLLMTFTLTGCNQQVEKASSKQSVTLSLEQTSSQDVDVYVDQDQIDTLKSQGAGTYELKLTKGNHELKVVQDGEETHLHHHLICTKCQKIIEMADELESYESFIKEKYGFDVIDHDLTFYGICKECQSSIQ